MNREPIRTPEELREMLRGLHQLGFIIFDEERDGIRPHPMWEGVPIPEIQKAALAAVEKRDESTH